MESGKLYQLIKQVIKFKGLLPLTENFDNVKINERITDIKNQVKTG